MANKDGSKSPNITPVSPSKGSLLGSLSSISLLNLNAKHDIKKVRSRRWSNNSESQFNNTQESTEKCGHDR